MKLTKNKLNKIIKEEIAKINRAEPSNEEILNAIDILTRADESILRENVELFLPLLKKIN